MIKPGRKAEIKGGMPLSPVIGETEGFSAMVFFFKGPIGPVLILNSRKINKTKNL